MKNSLLVLATVLFALSAFASGDLFENLPSELIGQHGHPSAKPKKFGCIYERGDVYCPNIPTVRDLDQFITDFNVKMLPRRQALDAALNAFHERNEDVLQVVAELERSHGQGNRLSNLLVTMVNPEHEKKTLDRLLYRAHDDNRVGGRSGLEYMYHMLSLQSEVLVHLQNLKVIVREADPEIREQKYAEATQYNEPALKAFRGLVALKDIVNQLNHENTRPYQNVNLSVLFTFDSQCRKTGRVPAEAFDVQVGPYGMRTLDIRTGIPAMEKMVFGGPQGQSLNVKCERVRRVRVITDEVLAPTYDQPSHTAVVKFYKNKYIVWPGTGGDLDFHIEEQFYTTQPEQLVGVVTGQ